METNSLTNFFMETIFHGTTFHMKIISEKNLKQRIILNMGRI